MVRDSLLGGLSGAAYVVLIGGGVWLVNKYLSDKGETVVLWCAVLGVAAVITYYLLAK
jgi:hypothetical protein